MRVIRAALKDSRRNSLLNRGEKKLPEKHQQREAGAASRVLGGEGGGRFLPSEKRPLTLRQGPGLPRRSSAPRRPPAPPLPRWQTRRGAGGPLGKRGSAVLGKGSQGAVLPLCGGGLRRSLSHPPPFPRKPPDFLGGGGGGCALPSRGGVIHERGWGQRKSPTEGQGTGELHLRGRGRSRLSPPQPADPRVSPLAAAGAERATRVPGDGQSWRGGGVSASALPCPPRAARSWAGGTVRSHPRRGRRRSSPLMRFFEIRKKGVLMLHPYLRRSAVFLPRRRRLLNNQRLSP